jgi:hypothetical protein
MIRVWIAYEPLIFREALISLLSRLDSVEIIDDISMGVDVGIFRLAATGQLQSYFRPRPLPNAKMIVFSPRGDRAYIRLPKEAKWTEIEPFSMAQLIAEICAGRDMRAIAQDNSCENIIYLPDQLKSAKEADVL